jgi:Zn-dependent M28 family amino/carboxypeptidase
LILTVVGGAVLSRRVATNDSPGAVDNATGVVAVLVAAEQLRHSPLVGVLVTGAEEYAMAGARVWAAAGGSQGRFINFDGIDSLGSYRVMVHGQRQSRGDESRRIGEAVANELSAAGAEVVTRGLPPGILVDGVALSRAGMPGVTVSRGNWNTLRVVHTKSDSCERVDIEAAITAGLATARAVEAVLG